MVLLKADLKKMSRQFNRQLKKLNRLQTKTDVDAQQALSDKYKRRAKIGAGVTAGLAAATAGSHLQTAMGNRKAYEGWRSEWNRADKASSEHLDWLFKHTGKNATLGNDHVKGLLEREMNNMERASRESARLKGQMSFGTAKVSTRTKVLAGATAAAAGYTAYAAIRSKVAKSRTTDKGHAKAVEKYKQQYSKMMDQFANTPYSELVKKQRKNIK